MYKRLRALRKGSGLMQRELAAYLHCSQVCYSGYELGRSDIPTDVLVRLAVFHETSIDYILDVTDEIKPYLRTKRSRSSDNMDKIYRRLRDLREDNDKKQRELAAYLGCSQVCYSFYELGRRDIPPAVLIKLAAYYNTSVDYLLGLTDERRPYPRRGKTAAAVLNEE